MKCEKRAKSKLHARRLKGTEKLKKQTGLFAKSPLLLPNVFFFGLTDQITVVAYVQYKNNKQLKRDQNIYAVLYSNTIDSLKRNDFIVMLAQMHALLKSFRQFRSFSDVADLSI